MIVTLIFLDEAGDTGFRFKTGSSRYFVVTMVIFDDPAQAAQVNEAIDDLRRKLRVPATREFRFSTGSSSDVKVAFLRALLPYTFRYRAVVVDKVVFAERHSWGPGQNLFESAALQLFEIGGLENVTLVMDRITGGTFEQKLYVYLRQHLKKRGARLIHKFRHADSRNDNLLQVADMLCGAIHRFYEDEEDKFRSIIQSKEEIVIEW